MPTANRQKLTADIYERLRQLTPEGQIEALLAAIDFMKEDPRRSRENCIGLALNIPIFPKVQSARIVNGYEVAIRFNNGEERLVDFRRLLDPGRELEKKLLDDEALFQRFEVADGAMAWPEVGRHGKDFEGNRQFFTFDIDPGLLFECSSPVQAA